MNKDELEYDIDNMFMSMFASLYDHRYTHKYTYTLLSFFVKLKFTFISKIEFCTAILCLYA